MQFVDVVLQKGHSICRLWVHPHPTVTCFYFWLLSSPQVQIGTLAPPDYSYPVPEASLEEQQQEQEEDEEEEIHLRPQLTPQGSGGSGILMGPETQKGLEKHTPLCIITTQFSYFQTVGPHSL